MADASFTVEALNQLVAGPVGSHTTNGSLAAAATLTPPEGASEVLIQAFTENVRVRIDNGTPTASEGFQILAGSFMRLPVFGATSVKVIEEDASASIQYQFLK